MVTIRQYTNPRALRLQPSRILLYVFLVTMALVVGFPIYWMLLVSIQPNEQVFSWPLQFWSTNPTLEHYVTVFTRQDVQLGRWFLNSVFVSTAVTAVTLLVTSLAAYGFARLEFPGRNIIFMVILFTLMVPSQITTIPVYLLVRELGWIDTYHAIIWPAAANVFGLFLLRQFFAAIPSELEEAAIMDGASRFRIYWQVILPLSTNALVTLTILVFLASWNDLFWPLIVLNRLEMRTISLGLTVLQGTFAESGGAMKEPGLLMAGSAVASIPMLLFYAVFQKRILQGVTLTGMGGR